MCTHNITFLGKETRRGREKEGREWVYRDEGGEEKGRVYGGREERGGREKMCLRKEGRVRKVEEK